MGGGVAAQLALVAGGGERLAVTQDRGPDRDVAVGLGQARLLDRQAHSQLMVWPQGRFVHDPQYVRRQLPRPARVSKGSSPGSWGFGARRPLR